jgi:IS30 family transposase
MQHPALTVSSEVVGMGVRLTVAERALIAQRWAAGVSSRQIARELVRPYRTVHGHVEWLRQRPPRPRCRSARQLSLAEREEISRGLVAGLGLRQIARLVGRAPSTVCREVARNGGRRRYRAATAEGRAWANGRRPKQAKLAADPRLRAVVESRLRVQWSPQQIARWLPTEFPDRVEMRVSHETIYMSLFVQTRGALRKELTAELRRGHASRRPRGYSPMNGQGQLRDTVHISQRPAEAEDRAVPGHWEGDLLFGRGMTAIATLVERHSRFVMLVKIPAGHTSAVVTAALTERIQQLPTELFRSLTWDHGKEMALHAQFTIDTGVQVYFCDPRSPWQRGSNENTNGLLRQYFPKGKTLAPYTQADLDEVAARLNGRPRQTLGWKTPSQTLEQALR